jgi:hypothetical protein
MSTLTKYCHPPFPLNNNKLIMYTTIIDHKNRIYSNAALQKTQKYWDIVQLFKFISLSVRRNIDAKNHTSKRTLQ